MRKFDKLKAKVEKDVGDDASDDAMKKQFLKRTQVLYSYHLVQLPL